VPRTFRELSGRGKVLTVGGSALLVAVLAVGTVVAAKGSGPGPLPSATGGERPTPAAGDGGGGASLSPLLPGETTWSGGAPSYDFGFNNGIEYAKPGFAELPSVQAQVKAAGLTIDRIWAPYESTGVNAMTSGDIADFTAHINAAKASGAACYVELGEVDNLPLLKDEVSFAEPMGCHMFEFGNEVDSAHSTSIANYTQQWNADIPALRALSVCAGPATVSRGCLFGGPTVMYPTWNDGTGSGYPSGVAYWMAKLDKTDAFPDFVSWHGYPCNGADAWDTTTANDQADCLKAIALPASSCTSNQNNCNYTSFGYFQQEVLGWEQQYLGKLVPTGISEYNFDPGSATLSKWGGDSQFMYEWTTKAIDAFVANHVAFAMQYTALDHAGYGDLDMFNDSAPYAPKAQFYGVAASVKKNGGPSALTIPNPLP
jgi:hypothetical protein